MNACRACAWPGQTRDRPGTQGRSQNDLADFSYASGIIRPFDPYVILGIAGHHSAVRLLLEKDMPLADVAERMNFSSLSYFSRYVQKHTGLSPSDYRRAHARQNAGAAHANVKIRKNEA